MRKKREHRVSDFDLGLGDSPNSGPGIRSERGNHHYSRKKRAGDSSLAWGFLAFLVIGGGLYLWSLMKESPGSAPSVQSTKKPKPVLPKVGKIVFSSQPEGARIFIDDKFIGKTPYTAENLQPGDYKVRLSRSGYRVWQQDIMLTSGGSPGISAQLKAAYYRLKIKSNAANIKLKFTKSKKRFKQGILLKPGIYHMVATAPGYQQLNKKIVIVDDDTDVTIRLEKAKVFYRVKVAIDPPQATSLAKIKIIDWPKAYSGRGIKLSPGKYKVEVKARGYKTKTQKIEVTDGAKTVKISLLSPGVVLKLDVKPKLAKIKILNFKQAYVSGMKVPPGKYRFVVSASGYKTKKVTQTIVKDKTIAIKLKADKYSIAVKATPAGAKVKIISPDDLEYSEKSKYSPGKYQIAVSAEGFNTVKKWIELKDKNQSIAVTLEKQSYVLNVNVVPKSAKVIFHNNTLAYKYGMKVAPGKYYVWASADGFDTKKTWVTIKDTKVSLSVKLKPNQFLISVDTVPANAKVRVLEPKTSYSKGKRFKPGKYKIEVSSPGFKPKVQWVDLKQGDAKLTVKLGEDAYNLVVKTTPAHAKIDVLNYPGNYNKGIKLIPGRYEIEVTASGYLAQKQWITVSENNESVTVVLKRQMYALTVVAAPGDAVIQIVDYPKKYTPGIKLPPGNYLIRAIKDNYKPISRWVTISNNDLTVDLKLEAFAKVLIE